MVRQGGRVLNQRKINRVSAGLLLLGLGGAVLIYALAPPELPEDPWRTDPLNQRRYVRQMQVMGAASAEEALLRLLDTQEEQDRWLLENKKDINLKIRRGIDQLDRGDGIPEDQLVI